MKKSAAFIACATLFHAGLVGGQELEPVISLDIGNPVNSIFISGNYAYLAAESLGLQIVDISIPQEAEIVGEFYPPGAVTDVFVRGDFAYTADDVFGLNIINISDPTDPEIAGVYETEGSVRVSVSDDIAYLISLAGDRCEMVDISEPANPYHIGDLGEGWYALGRDSLVYLTYGDCSFPYDCYGGFYVFDISNLEDPQQLGLYWGWTPGLDLSIIGNLAYLVGGGFFIYDFGQLQVIDIADPGNPELLGGYYSEDIMHAVAVQGRYAFLAAEVLIIVNIDDPYNPLFVTTYQAQGSDVAVDGDYVYLAEGNALTILRFIITSIDDDSGSPSTFSLFPNYPNPFNASTVIGYYLPEEGRVVIEIYDILGRKIKTLVDGMQPAGSHSVVWDAGGSSSGLYFYRMKAGDNIETRRCVLLK